MAAVIPMGLATVGGLWYYWKEEIQSKRPAWIEEKVRESNVEQDTLIRNQILHFQRQGADWEGLQLQRALQYKQAIENRLLVKQPSLPIWERLETLVDTLIYSLIEELENYRLKRGKTTPEDISEAIEQLAETDKDLDDIIAPHVEPDQADLLPREDKLLIALEELKEERAIAQRVKERMETQFSETTYASSLGVEE